MDKSKENRDAVQVLVEDLPKIGMMLCDVVARCRKVKEEKGVAPGAVEAFDIIGDKLNGISSELLKLYKPIFIAAKTAHAMAMVKVIVVANEQGASEAPEGFDPSMN